MNNTTARRASKTMKITDEQIERLAEEAGSIGDLEQVRLCERALGAGKGAAKARRACERVIAVHAVSILGL